MEVSAFSQLAEKLTARRWLFQNEKEMQVEIERLLLSIGQPFHREHRLGRGDIPDFFLPGQGDVVEVKWRCGELDVLRQLKRYGDYPEVKHLNLVAIRPVDLPTTLSGKPCRGIFLWRQVF
jgi:hypothetical protein